MKCYRISIMLFLVMPFMAESQDSDSARAQNIKTYPDYFLFKGGVSNRSLNLLLFPRENGITQFFDPVLYRPSVQNTISVGAGFKGFAVAVGFKLAQNPLVKVKQGESTYFDFRINSLGKKVGYDINVQEYRSYFINDLNDLFNNLLSGTTQRRRDDMQLKNYSANVFYTFNSDEFSYRAAFVHDERQLKSAGSFILSASLGYIEAKGDSSLVPTDTDIDFDPRAYYSDAQFYTCAITPGYAYTWASPKGLYVSMGASGMIGLHYFEAIAERLQEDGFNYFLKGIIRASAGYNGDKWIVRVAGSSDIQGLNTRLIQYQINNLDVSFFLGYRLKTNWMSGQESFFDFLKKK